MAKYLVALLFVISTGTCVRAQMEVPPAPELELARVQHQRRAMLVLGGWAVTNIGLGLALRNNTEGATARFHEMNAIWNTVNLGIAGIGYYMAMRDGADLDAIASLRENNSFQKILLFNAGLDIGYMAGGLYLLERGRRPDADADQLKGYGRSIVLQGGFLFVFDLVNFFIANGRDDDYRLLFGPVGEGLGLSYTF